MEKRTEKFEQTRQAGLAAGTRKLFTVAMKPKLRILYPLFGLACCTIFTFCLTPAQFLTSLGSQAGNAVFAKSPPDSCFEKNEPKHGLIIAIIN